MTTQQSIKRVGGPGTGCVVGFRATWMMNCKERPHVLSHCSNSVSLLNLSQQLSNCRANTNFKIRVSISSQNTVCCPIFVFAKISNVLADARSPCCGVLKKDTRKCPGVRTPLLLGS